MPANQIEQLRTRVRGGIVQPGDPAYDSARKVYNGMIDKRPALIVQCVDVADVIAAVDYARTNDVLTAIRGGGHNGGGLGTCDDGLVIDLSAMKGVRVDPVARTAHVAAGCIVGRRRPCHASLRSRRAEWLHLDDRRRRPHPRRRHRLPHSRIRSHHRQSPLGRRDTGRRQLCHRGRTYQSGSVLGAARWRRQLRRGDVVRIPLCSR